MDNCEIRAVVAERRINEKLVSDFIGSEWWHVEDFSKLLPINSTSLVVGNSVER